MKVIPLAAESLGVRSMATYVEAGSLSVLIDPGATLAAQRFNLPPADEEWDALRRANDRISAYAQRAQWIFVSHYHDDHFRSDPSTYAGRRVLAKDPRRMVAGAQARRAAALWKTLEGHATTRAADGWALQEANVELHVSAPLPHGLEGSPLGSLVALTIIDRAERARFVFASDVQGPLSAVATAWIIQQRPTLLYLSGPPSYVERDLGAAVIDRGVDNLLRVLDATGCRAIVDHYALRDTRWRERFERLWSTGRAVTAAQHVGVEPQPLEARRHMLWTASARKPPARARPGARATMTGEPRRYARGGAE